MRAGALEIITSLFGLGPHAFEGAARSEEIMIDQKPALGPSAPKKAPLVTFAKWPPDDDAPGAPAGPPGMPGMPGGGGVADDGNFKRGRFAPMAILVAVLLAVGGVVFVVFGLKSEGDKMTVEQIAKTKKDIFVLPQKEQAVEWKKWAKDPNEPALQQEALIQLAFEDDPEGVDLATKAMASPDHKVTGTAAQVLAYYGSPRADAAKPALLAAMKASDMSDRPQIVWALVELKEPSVFQEAMSMYSNPKASELAKVERLGGGAAFDPQKLAKLVSLDELAKKADDPSPSVRQLVATVLSENAESKWTPVLKKLVVDADPEVGRQAANGLGKIADESAKAALLEALNKCSDDAAQADSRQKFLEALRDGVGGEGLVLALYGIKPDPEERAWFRTKQIMEMLRDLADPRAADALVKWVETTKPSEHWVAEAGTRLAEIGDVRAAKYLGERMKIDPSKLYKLEKFWEADEGGHLSKTDLPRVVAARMLADLAQIHPEAKDQLKRDAEDGVMFWIKDKPQPHANGLRFLATVQSEKALQPMREWAFPKKDLPKEGQQPPFPSEFETAQSALRYLGKMKDEQSFPKLIDQFKRKKDKKMDITQAGLEGAGLAMLGMALRAVAYGAANGLGEWGDPRAVKPMEDFIEDETWHEEARQAACEALAWCADDKEMLNIAKKAKDFATQKGPTKHVIAACYASTLTNKPVPSIVPDLAKLITPDLEPQVRNAIARAIGVSGFDKATEDALFALLQNVEVRNDAALALILGGSTDTAARTIAMYAEPSWKDALDDLKDKYFTAFGYWSDEDFKKGNLYRWVDNAVAISHVKINDVPQEWAVQRLGAQFDNLKFDNGPHSETRVVLRFRLLNAAKTGDAKTKQGAIETLKFMKEKGCLMALRHEQGDTGALAEKAFYELMHPKAAVADKPLPETAKGKGGPPSTIPIKQ